MKYLSLSTIENAFKGCKGKTQNKFWGLLAILNVIDKKIASGIGYSFQSSEVSSILDDLFNLKEGSNDNRRGDTWSVLFSKKWIEVIPEIMFDNKPNIYDVASWYFRKRSFADDFYASNLLSLFMKTFHFSLDNAKYLFDMKTKEIEFTPYLYSNDDLFSRIKGEDDIPNEAKCISFENSRYLKSYAGNLGQASFVQTLYSAQGPQKCLILTQFDFNEEYKKGSNTPMDKELQIIFYGAPGTGKSHKIKDDAAVKEAEKKNMVFRTTFHPDSDYSTFVGAYKPTMKPVADKYKAVAGKDEEITYEFIPQAFLQAYIAAWNNPEEKVFLVIEEINRGNCAQIFGDLFQLLDRDDNGFSEYPIKADRDLAKYLNGKDDQGIDVLKNEDGIKNGKLLLPKNLYIWATMNTSDQSLFPIDSAFKRRWDWIYMPIGYKNTNWTIEIGDKKYEWVKFQRIINDKIYGVDNSEDKQLGDYFVNADRTNNKISADTLLNKILFYIWNDVCKDDPDQIFQWVNDNNQDESIKFSDFFGEKKVEKLQGFMAYHKVPVIGETDDTDNAENTNNQEETPAENDNEINS